MRICLVSPAGEGEDATRRLAALLAARHEVTLIHDGRRTAADFGTAAFREVVAEPSSELAGMAFAGEEHRRSAEVLEAIERAYGDRGPDYVEACDRGAAALVPLLARRGGHPLLSRTLFGVRLIGSAELTGLHDGNHGRPGMALFCDLEREQLRLADRLIHPGGDVLNLYRRYYSLTADAAEIALPFPPPDESLPGRRVDRDEPLRILYAGPLLRRLGPLDLAEACLRLPLDEWRLTMVGPDTRTGPAGQSVRMTIEQMLDDDPRLRIVDRLPEEEMHRRWSEDDLFAFPAGFATWPEPVLEAMAAGMPVLATPVGGLTELVAPGATGWLSSGVGPEALRRKLVELLENRDEPERVRASGLVAERLRSLTDPQRILDGYAELLDDGRRAAPGPAGRNRSRRPPLVTGIVPYFRASEHVEEAIGSLLAQTHRELEVLVVNDGSFEQDDEVLARLDDPRVEVVTTLNAGETSARNLGARLARGEYVAMLDSDNVLEPEFVARALAVFEREPELAYVSCWLRFIAPDGSPHADPAGYAPIGNSVVRDDTDNWDGDTLALLPRKVFTDLGYGFDPSAVIYSDWELYRRLREDGRFGTVIPERLAKYRVLPESLQRAHGLEMRRRGWDEARGRRILRRTRWTAEA